MKNHTQTPFSGVLRWLCLMLPLTLFLSGALASGNGSMIPRSNLNGYSPGLKDGHMSLTLGISVVNTVNDFCGAGGSITVSFSGGTGSYNLSWSGGGSVSNVTSPYTINGLTAGSYVVTVSDGSATESTPSQTIFAGSIKNQSSGAAYNDVQAAINAATPGDVIELCSGTFSSSLTVNKKLDIRGQGSSTIIQNSGGTAITFTAAGSGSAVGDRAYLRNVKISGSNKGIYADQLVNYITLDGVSIDGNTSYGIHINNISGVMNDWAMTNCTFNGNSSGIYISTAANLNGLSITGSTITNQVNSGIYVGQSSTTPGGLNNVTISGNTFTGNGSLSNNQAALYIEKLSNATISGNTFTNNGLDVNPRAISINLKYGNYTGVTINGNTFMENRGAIQNTSGANSGYALNVSGRNDPPSYLSFPGTLANVTITNNQVTGFIRGIQVENATDWNTTTIENNKLSNCTLGIIGAIFPSINPVNNTKTLQAHNNSIVGSLRAVVNTAQNGAVMNATCNWFGSASANVVDTSVIDTTVNGIIYLPWLTNGTDNNVAIGFQPVPNFCNGTAAPTFTSSVTNASCFGLSNGSISLSISGGTSPYSVSINNAEGSLNNTGLPAGNYTVIVTDVNGSSSSAVITVGQANIPSPAGVISGTAVACVPGLASSIPFSVPASTNATIYNWVYNGLGLVTIANNGTQNITLNYTAPVIQNGISGTLTVTPIDACGNEGTPRSLYVEYQVTQPVTPGSISGPGKLCPTDLVTYSIAPVARATAYTWTLPSTMTIQSGVGTNIITVLVGSGYVGGTISVTASNNCGASPSRSKSLVTNLPSTPGTISGLSSGLCGANGVTYTIAPVTAAISYTWSISGGSFSSTPNTGTSVTANWLTGITSGSLTVSSVNACGISASRTLTVAMVPARPNPITGILNPPCINFIDTASVPTVTGSTSYVWQISSGGAITAGQGAKDVQVTWGATPAASQSITVRATNLCGTGLTRALTGINVVTCFNRTGNSGSQELEMEVFPNPANDWMQCSFRSQTEQRYRIQIMDLSGRLIVVEEGTADSGLNRVDLNADEISSGAYMLQLRVGENQSVQRIVID